MLTRQFYRKYALPIWAIATFTTIGIVMWIIRDWRYFALFAGIGLNECIARTIVIRHPSARQTVRRVIQLILAAILLVMLGLVYGVNFQFEQIFFDLQAGIITGALVQLIIARLLMPLLFGNAFCSRACWDGAIFETIPTRHVEHPQPRRWWIAWLYIIALISLTILVTYQWTNPADPNYDNANILLRKNWIIGQNLFLLTVGTVTSQFWGSRFYCRQLCPFMTISSLLYPLSWYKITPIHPDRCTQCGKCNTKCPMLSDIRADVKANRPVSNKQCILCEQCVSACPQGILTIAHPKKHTNKH